MDDEPAARLSKAQLAAESETDEAYLDTLVEAGVIHPVADSFSWTDVYRVRTLRSIEATGMPIERITAPFRNGRLSLDFLEHMLPQPEPRTGRTFAEFAASLGPKAESAGAVYEMLGLALPPDGMLMRSDEEALVGTFVEIWGDDPRILKRAARVAGYAIRLIIEGWTGLHYELYAGSDQAGRGGWSEELRGREQLNAVRAIRLVAQLPGWLAIRHFEQVMSADIMESIESEIDPFGRRAGEREGIRQPAIVFVDLSGYVAMTEAQGDGAASATTARFEEAVALAALRGAGRVVKLLGDGALLHFGEAVAAVRATLRIRDELSDLPQRLHAGIDCGPVAERDGDVFGRTVNMASRLASAASDGQVLVSGAVAQAGAAAGIRVSEVGPMPLKGLEHPVSVYLVDHPPRPWPGMADGAPTRPSSVSQRRSRDLVGSDG